MPPLLRLCAGLEREFWDANWWLYWYYIVYGALTLNKRRWLKISRQGSVVSMICDSGERYLNSYYNDDWVAQANSLILPYTQQLESVYANRS